MVEMVRCRCGVDVHAHVVPENFPRSRHMPTPADWPSMAEAEPCHRHVMISGKVYRTVSDKCWDTAKRVADMDAMDLALQVVSPMPELLSYWMDAAPAAELLGYINDQIAEMVAPSGGRIAGLGGVALQDCELALRELHRVVGELGFAGVEIGSNINGRPIGAPEFEDFFAECEKLGAAVFVHALRPCGMARLIGPPPLQQPLAQARAMFYDGLVFDEPTLLHIAAMFGTTQIMLGTDYPFNFHDRRPVDRVMATFADPAVRENMQRGNALRFLGREKGDMA